MDSTDLEKKDQERKKKLDVKEIIRVYVFVTAREKGSVSERLNERERMKQRRETKQKGKKWEIESGNRKVKIKRIVLKRIKS